MEKTTSKLSPKSSDLLLALYNNDRVTAIKLKDSLSTEELQKTLRILDIAGYDDPELKAAIADDKKFIQNALNKRDAVVHEIVK
jgi:hypothetical protein